jgi:transketolase
VKNVDLVNLAHKAIQIRREALKMIAEAGSGHPGGSLSAADIFAALYFHVMHYDPKNPALENRDRFVLSKGHATGGFYATLALAGFFPMEWLAKYRKLGSPLLGHPDRRRVPGVENSSGSLGQGLSIGIGMAIAGRIKQASHHIYVLLSDGETEEGQVWEAANFAGMHKLDNLIAIIDYNKYQLDGAVKDILDMEPYADKWRAFKWDVQEIDGHELPEILGAIDKAKNATGKPQMIIAHTIKGKGVSFMENNNHFHGVAPTKEELAKALAELDAAENKIDAKVATTNA